jgi:GNAT superfamily N-acetyltransferase
MPVVLAPHEFRPDEASPDEWRRYHAFRRRQQAEWRPDEPLMPDHVAEARLRLPDRRVFDMRWHLRVGDEVVSVLEAEATRPESPEYETNRHLLWAFAYVLAGHRRRGIGRGWVPKVLELMDRHGATVLSAIAEDEPGHALLRKLGGEARMTERESRLELAVVDWEMVARWVEAGQRASPASRHTVYTGRIPDELLPEFCLALSELLNTIPFEDLDHGKIVVTPEQTRDWYLRLEVSGSLVHTALVRDPDGSIVGITDIRQNPYEPGLVRQGFTGVHPRARGRGLGKWLKAAMLQHVRRAHPDAVAITTENAGSNAPMLAINTALGFRLHRVRTFYQVSRETLSQAVGI